MSDPQNIFDGRKQHTVPLGSLLFATTLAVAALLYLVTGEVVVAIVLPCLYAGWNTFRTGLRILGSDPYRSRARTCFAFYLAAACWKAAAAALVSVAAFVLLARTTGIEPSMKEFAANMLVLLGGVMLNALLGVAATCAAVFGRIRVWVHPRLRTAVYGDLRWAARLEARQHGFNHAVFVVATALVFPVAGAGAIMLAACTVGTSREEVATTQATIFALVAILGGPLAMIPCYAWLSSRVIASSPGECWPTDTLEASK